MRNCPGAGRPNCIESFSSASRDGQLSTKLETGILGQKEVGWLGVVMIYTENKQVRMESEYIVM